MSNVIRPVIIAGGVGSRLWPLSREHNPKQFLSLLGEKSMLQMTLDRVDNFTDLDPIVICNEKHRFLAAEQLRETERKASIILEPEGKNTAPAIAVAALHALKNNEDPILLVLAADHNISDADSFNRAVEQGVTLAMSGQLVTFGVAPTSIETGYGYIKVSEDSKSYGKKIIDFVEKPDYKTAKIYFESGDYYWNSGMFMFQASHYITELAKYSPEILQACELSLAKSKLDLDFIRLDNDAFSKCPSDSIDYAVMEKTKSAVMMELNAGWSDIGSWSSLWEISEKDVNDNVISGDVIAENTSASLVHAHHRLIATLGVEDLVIVETKDVVFVANKKKVQDVKKITALLKNASRGEFESHREVYRPWGVYDSIDHGERYQVKRITVKPGAKLSVQMHHHRAEHWIVVSGTAKVTVGDDDFLVTENESTFIPIGKIHSLENPGKIALELIEVQSGSYLGEDDIVRLQDLYGRK